MVDEPINGEIRARLARTRTSQRAFATLVSEHLGRAIPQSKLNERLNGRTPWRLAELRAVAAVFGLRLSELIAESEREQSA
jgi:hypothetical protein